MVQAESIYTEDDDEEVEDVDLEDDDEEENEGTPEGDDNGNGHVRRGLQYYYAR